ncbi:hypothetical protein EDD21DRAFT_368134 [Dissophora ornata]|nr:hypothetical protein EDD21DRAFT_368134 [Dissophora ornata]
MTIHRFNSICLQASARGTACAVSGASVLVHRPHRHAMTSSLRESSCFASATVARTYNSRSGPSGTSASKSTTAGKGMDPDKIKGPGGLTMTQIGKLVQQSHAKDLEHQAKKQQQSSKAPKS